MAKKNIVAGGLLLMSACVFLYALAPRSVHASVQDAAQESHKADAAKGKQLYETNCALCHDPTAERASKAKIGPGLKGVSKWGPDTLSDGTEHKDHSAEVLRLQIVKGGGQMSPVGASFSGEDLDDLVAYLQTI
jgi:mono/diheme cytochrome c family protein